MAKQNYYDILGVAKSANKDEIKKAFYKLAGKHHPDKGGDESKFKEINEAYQTLSDEKKKKEYDMYGESFAGRSGGSASQSQNGFGGFNQNDFQNMNFDFGDMGGFEDMFGDMFSGFGFDGFGGSPKQRRGRDISIDIEISFEESIFGVERNVLVNKLSNCNTCEGSGAKKESGTVTCTTCNGKGKVHEARRTFMGTVQTVRVCDACDGSGKIPKEKCADCKGAGVKNSKEEIHIVIPAGINSGEMIRMTGAGEGIKNGLSGDMFIKVRVSGDKLWSREGYNLVMNHKIKLSDALLGGKHIIYGIDGKIDLDIPAGVSINEVIKITGRGVPNQNRGRGDAIIRLHIELPKKLSKKAKGFVEELREEGL